MSEICGLLFVDDKNLGAEMEKPVTETLHFGRPRTTKKITEKKIILWHHMRKLARERFIHARLERAQVKNENANYRTTEGTS